MKNEVTVINRKIYKHASYDCDSLIEFMNSSRKMGNISHTKIHAFSIYPCSQDEIVNLYKFKKLIKGNVDSIFKGYIVHDGIVFFVDLPKEVYEWVKISTPDEMLEQICIWLAFEYAVSDDHHREIMRRQLLDEVADRVVVIYNDFFLEEYKRRKEWLERYNSGDSDERRLLEESDDDKVAFEMSFKSAEEKLIGRPNPEFISWECFPEPEWIENYDVSFMVGYLPKDNWELFEKHGSAWDMMDGSSDAWRKFESYAWENIKKGTFVFNNGSGCEDTKENGWGYVYLIDGGENITKIGWSKKDPKIRMQDLQVGSPVKLKLIGSVVGVGMSVEKSLHEYFRGSRSHGEWFHLSPTDKQNILNPAWRKANLDV